MGQEIIIETLDFEKFPLIVNSYNHEKLTKVICNNNPPSLYEILGDMAKKNRGTYSDVTSRLLPISVFDTEFYKNLDHNVKFDLITLYNKYELYNELINLSYKQAKIILLNPIILQSNNSIFVRKAIKGCCNAYNKTILHILSNEYKNTVFTNGNYLIITNFFPLKTYYCIRIGYIRSVIDGKTVMIDFEGAQLDWVIKRGSRLINGQQIMVIDQLFDDDVEEEVMTFVFVTTVKCKITFTEPKFVDNKFECSNLLLIVMDL